MHGSTLVQSTKCRVCQLPYTYIVRYENITTEWQHLLNRCLNTDYCFISSSFSPHSSSSSFTPPTPSSSSSFYNPNYLLLLLLIKPELPPTPPPPKIFLYYQSQSDIWPAGSTSAAMGEQVHTNPLPVATQSSLPRWGPAHWQQTLHVLTFSYTKSISLTTPNFTAL